MKEKTSLIDKAMDILQQSNLSEEDVSLWKESFTEASPDAVSLFIDTFTNNDDAELLEMTTESLRKKIAAKDDLDEIQKIADEEEEILKKGLQR